MTVYLPCYVQSPALGNMATLEDDDEMVLISADELDGMHRAMPSDALSAEAESEGEGEEEEELKGTALDDYQPSDERVSHGARIMGSDGITLTAPSQSLPVCFLGWVENK